MVFLSAIENAEHTFAAWAAKEWVTLYAEAPKIEQIADAVLKYVGPVLGMVVTAEAGAPAGAVVAGVVSEAQSDLAAASGLIYDFGATPSASSILSGVQSNLGALLTAGHVTSPTSVANVQKAVTEVSTLATAVAAAIPAATAAPAAAGA